MHQRWTSWLRSLSQNIRSLMTGWLVAALLAPMALGLVAPLQPMAQDAMVHDAMVLCAGNHSAAQDNAKGPQHSSHDQDCPCCVMSSANAVALPPPEAVLLPAANWHQEKLVLVAFTLRLVAGQPFRFAPARGPPSILSI